MRLGKKITTFLVCAGITAGAAEYIVPQAAGTPVIDGKLGSEEWENALAISGAGTMLDQRKAQAYFMWSASHFYIGIRSETPPREKPVVRGGAVIHDDSIELWFDPPEAIRTVEQHKFGEFQLLVNSQGTVYARHHNPGYGLSARKWKPELTVANHMENGVWEIEIAIPAQAFGMTELIPSDWKILPVRNFRTKPELQAPFTPVASFSDTSQYAVFHLRQGPTVKNGYAKSSHIPSVIQIVGGNKGKYYLTGKVGKQKFERATTETDCVFDLTSLMPSDGATVEYTLYDQNHATIFRRVFRYNAKAERVWFTPESYLVLEHDFKNGPAKPRVIPAGSIAVPQGNIKTVPGRNEHSTAGFFKTAKDSITFRNFQPPVPGCISLWLKPDSGQEKPFRRYFATRFSQEGYLGLQDQGQYMLLFLHNFGKAPENIISARKPPIGRWTHIAVNLHPGKIEYYQNGVKLSETSLSFTVASKRLGDLAIGGGAGGFNIDHLAVYSRCLEADEIKVLAQGEQKVTGDIALYPSINALVVDLNCNAEKLRSGKLMLNLANAENQSVFQDTVSLKHGWAIRKNSGNVIIIHQSLPLGEKLPEGSYLLTLNDSVSGETLLEKNITVKHYPWLNNTIGKNDRIIPPFIPLSVQGNRISCILRDYIFNGSGLPQQIKARGKEILAGPIELCTESNGKIQALSHGSFRITGKSDTSIQYQGESFGALNVHLKGNMEFDGMIRLDMTIPKTGYPFSGRLFLDIPLKKEFAILYHAAGEGIRSNPAGFLPEGKGTIWKSTSIPQINYNNFIPYLWIGDDERGICYAADWDKDWVHGKSHDAVELFRKENGDVSIRLNLLNNPLMNRDRQISIALMASPVKPQPAGWRGWSDGFFFEGTKVARCLYSPPYWGSFTNWTSRYPTFKDFNYIHKLSETVKTGVVDEKFKKEWIRRVLKSRPGENPKRVSVHTHAAFEFAKQLNRFKDRAVLYPYTCNAETAEQLDEYPVMQGEWKNGVRVSNSSYADYSIYYLKEMLKAGFNGVYNDNTFFVANFNWATGDAYIDENGTVHPSLGLWKNRDYMKRQVFLMHQLGMEPWLTVHHTNANILPVLSMATNTMGMEWKYGVSDFQERFTPDYIRAVCQGRQGGFFPTVLDGIAGGDQKMRSHATRTMLATLLPHEVRPTCPRSADVEIYRKVHDLMFRFGIHKEDCIYTAYWNPENPVKSADEKILTSTYRRGRRLLVFCGSNKPQDTITEFKTAYRLHSVKNLENGQSYPVKDGTVRIPLKKHDFLLLEMELEH